MQPLRKVRASEHTAHALTRWPAVKRLSVHPKELKIYPTHVRVFGEAFRVTAKMWKQAKGTSACGWIGPLVHPDVD